MFHRVLSLYRWVFRGAVWNCQVENFLVNFNISLNLSHLDSHKFLPSLATIAPHINRTKTVFGIYKFAALSKANSPSFSVDVPVPLQQRL